MRSWRWSSSSSRRAAALPRVSRSISPEAELPTEPASLSLRICQRCRLANSRNLPKDFRFDSLWQAPEWRGCSSGYVVGQILWKHSCQGLGESHSLVEPPMGNRVIGQIPVMFCYPNRRVPVDDLDHLIPSLSPSGARLVFGVNAVS